METYNVQTDLTKKQLRKIRLIKNIVFNGMMVMEFSKYIDGPGSTTKKRKIIHINRIEFNEKWVSDRLSELKKNERFAIHSRIKFLGDTYHIPMIDFKGKEKIKFTSNLISPNVELFETENSYHGYIPELISNTRWYGHMSSLLNKYAVLNDIMETIDIKWVGHSLVNGYSALRLKW